MSRDLIVRDGICSSGDGEILSGPTRCYGINHRLARHMWYDHGDTRTRERGKRTKSVTRITWYSDQGVVSQGYQKYLTSDFAKYREAKGIVYVSTRFFRESCMCRSWYGFPDPAIGYWPEGVLSHVCILPNLRGHTLKVHQFVETSKSMEFERILLRNGFGVIEIVSECRECPERYRKSSRNILKCLEYWGSVFGLFYLEDMGCFSGD